MPRITYAYRGLPALASLSMAGSEGDAIDQLKERLNSKLKFSPEPVDAQIKPATLANTDLEPAIQLRESGDYQKAHAWLEGWNLKHPNDPEVIAHLAHLLLLLKKDDLALKKLNQALSMAPDSALVQRNLARIYLKRNKPNDALTAATKAFDVDSHNHENRLVLASALAASGEKIKALKLVESIIKTNSDYAEAYATRAILRLQSKDLKSAIVDCEKALSIKPHLVQLRALSAKLYYQEKSLLKAITALEQALIIEPDNIGYMIDIGEFYRQAEKTEQSLSILSKAVELAPERENAWINYGTVLQQLERLPEAKTAYHHAFKINPSKPELLNNLGTMAKSAGELQELVEYFTKAIQLNPESAQAHSNLGNALKELGQLEEAVKSYEQALAIKPDNIGAHINLGNALKELGQLEEAVKSYEQALAIKPDYAEVHYNHGITLQELGQLEAAVKSYEQALSIKADYAEAHSNLGVTLQELGQLEAAVKSFEQALAIKPDYAEAQCNLGNTLKKLGQLEEAVKRYEQAFVIKPDYAEAHSNLGNTLKELGQLEAAVKSYEQALSIKADYAEAHSNLGVTLQELGQLEAAVKSFEQALAIKPGFAEAHSNLGNTLQELGQLEEAVKRYEQALAIKPDYAEVHSNLGVTLQELGQLEAAVKSYEQALGIKPDYAEAWGNVFFTAKALDLSTTQNTWLESYKKNLDVTVLNSIHFKILEYRLNAFTPHTVNDCFNDAINTFPLISYEEIQNPSPTHQNEELSSLPNNMTALIHFGRSGTGLLHSLIDNHPEISTFPSIYFSEYYNAEVWGKLIAQGWDQLPENFIKQFAVLFDARSSAPVPSADKPIANLGQQEGMVNVGANRDEVLTVDQNRFCTELRQIMAECPSLTPQTFFTLVHSAYEKALNKSSNKQTVFYHIHNPSPYAKLNFLRYNPKARLLMMVREPVQSCESWVKKVIKESSENTHNRIVTLLFDIDQIAFRRQDSIGIRLEDLKARPEATLAPCVRIVVA